MFILNISSLNPAQFLRFSLIVLLFFYSCRPEEKKENAVVKEVPVSFQEKVKNTLLNRLNLLRHDTITDISKDTFYTSEWMYSAFEKNNFYPLWTNDSVILSCADSLLSILDSAFYYGLIPSDYRMEKLTELSGKQNKASGDSVKVKRFCELNLFLTEAFFRFAIDLRKGRLDPDSLNRIWKGNKNDSLITNQLLSAIRQNKIRETIRTYEPDLEKYRELRKFLFTCKDSAECAKISLNLERWRWESKLYEDYVININLPSYTMKYYECDTLKLQSRVIVGKPETQTPARLNSKIVYFWVYPYWMVPLSIATKEILPALIKDTAYLRKHNMEVLDGYNNVLIPENIKWKKYSESYFPFKIRQRDGDENTLGVLKFIFPNKFDIYLHDTNSRGLFQKQKRALSHGCIRLEKAKQLAKKIIGCCTLNYNVDSLNLELKNKSRKRVDLFTRIPIHIRYYTCETDSGRIKFYDDIYGRDEKMMENLMPQQ